MDKIIGLNNALIDVLAALKDDTLSDELELPKGSIQLIDDAKLQQISTKFSQMKAHLATSGSAGNAILRLACLSAGIGFIGKVGDSYYSDFFRKNLQDNNVEDDLLTSGQSLSGVASTSISRDGGRTFGTYLGTAASLKAEDLILEMLKGYACLFIERYLVQDHEVIPHAVELAREAGPQICLDTASYNIAESDLELFSLLTNKYVDIVFADEREAKAFTDEEPGEALRVIAKKCSITIVRVEANGSYIHKGTEEIKVSAIPVEKVLGTTGAGDYFAAGFLYGLMYGYLFKKCTKIGSIPSGDVIRVIGATVSPERWDEVELNINKVLTE